MFSISKVVKRWQLRSSILSHTNFFLITFLLILLHYNIPLSFCRWAFELGLVRKPGLITCMTGFSLFPSLSGVKTPSLKEWIAVSDPFNLLSLWWWSFQLWEIVICLQNWKRTTSSKQNYWYKQVSWFRHISLKRHTSLKFLDTSSTGEVPIPFSLCLNTQEFTFWLPATLKVTPPFPSPFYPSQN